MEAKVIVIQCEKCNGKGTTIADRYSFDFQQIPCPVCHGYGVVRAEISDIPIYLKGDYDIPTPV